MAAGIVRYGLSDRVTPREREKSIRVSFRGSQVESFTSDRFAFIPNWKVCDGLRILEGMGWKVPPARPSEPGTGTRLASRKDVERCGTLIKEGDTIGPAGLYASDKDMFAFLVNEKATVDDGTGSNGLRRGIFVSNSEVGAAAFKVTFFLYDHVCGNHIVWGASAVLQAKVRHIGDEAPARAFAALEKDLMAWNGKEASQTARLIKEARKMILGKTVEDIAERLVCEKRLYVGKSDAKAAYALAEQHDAERVDPRSVWGMVSGFTRLSQQELNSDRRVLLDNTGAGLMKLVDPAAQCGILKRGSGAAVDA
jgi:hypothetical protein